MSRRLSEDETALWDRLRQTVKPLHKRRPESPRDTAAGSEAPAGSKPAAKKAGSSQGPTPAKAPKPKAASGPGLAPIETKTLRRLSRGLVTVDARIDLHGMRQERAFRALGSFLRHAQARGDRIVLVVTGKGRKSEDGDWSGGERRGVLKSAVPAWLSHAELRPYVVGFEEAGRRHGGAGALYVQVRRRRADARDPQA